LALGPVLLIVAFILSLGLWVSPAQALGDLVVQASPGLTLLGEPVVVSIEGTGTEPGPEVEVVVRLGGPAEPSQLGQIDPLLPAAASVATTVGASGLSTRAVAGTGPSPWDLEVEIPGDLLDAPGGYLVTVELSSAGSSVASGRTWLGKVAPQAEPLDVSFVLPIALGVHRDPDGVFFDRVLEEAIAPGPEDTADLRAITELPARYPGWQFTYAVEPILLTQLRDMADGYIRLGESGVLEEVSAEDPSAKNAAELLLAFRDMASAQTVEAAAGPYSGADLGALAAEGWRDGFDQLQLGKRELQQTLGLAAAPSGAFSPDLDMTTESLSYYSQASIDHVVIDGQLAADLTEPVAKGAVAARVRDTDNDRVTLVFADSILHTLVAPPWDPAVFYAGLAAELAASPKDATVIVPGGDFVVPPAAYLEAVGQSLTQTSWIETQTLTSLLRVQAPDSRPVLLARNVGGSQSYIEGALLDSLRAAHAAVVDLAVAADPTADPLENARRLLYIAESRWWWHPQTSPQVASVGLQYAEAAEVTARSEIEKVSFDGASPARIFGRRGTVNLALGNGADYPLDVLVQVSGEGLAVAGGSSFPVELQPGRNEVPLEVEAEDSPFRLDVRVMVGSTMVAGGSHSVRPITLWTFLPWVLLGLVAIGAVVLASLWVRRRRRHA
jgi:hypothetical protein